MIGTKNKLREMEAKEKAKELFDSYYALNADEEYEWCTQISRPIAKKCALLSVEEIIKEYIEYSQGDHWRTQGWWQQVKEEIQRL